MVIVINNNDDTGPYSMPGRALTLSVCYLKPLRRKFVTWIHFTGGVSEVQGSYMTCPRSHSQEVTEVKGLPFSCFPYSEMGRATRSRA